MNNLVVKALNIIINKFISLSQPIISLLISLLLSLHATTITCCFRCHCSRSLVQAHTTLFTTACSIFL